LFITHTELFYAFISFSVQLINSELVTVYGKASDTIFAFVPTRDNKEDCIHAWLVVCYQDVVQRLLLTLKSFICVIVAISQVIFI